MNPPGPPGGTPPVAQSEAVTLCLTCLYERFRVEPRGEQSGIGRYCARSMKAVHTAADHAHCPPEKQNWYEKRAESTAL